MRILAFLEAVTVTGPAKNIIEFARQAPVEIIVATFQRQSKPNDFTRAVEAAGIPLHIIHERRAFDTGVVAQMRRIVEQVQPDILQTHAIKSHFLMRASGLWKRRPWIAFHHGYTFTDAKQKLYNQLDRWSLRKSRRVITVSRAFARQLADIGVDAGRIEVVHNAIDPAWGEIAHLRQQKRAELQIEEQDKVLLIVGRLSREKAHGALVEALARLRHLCPEVPVKLLIVGDGPERGTIERIAAAHGVRDQVILTGYTADVAPYYAAADIAVLASVTEGSPNALLEAMAASLPVVATAVGGIPEIVSDHETAILVPAGDVEALAQGLREVLMDETAAREMAVRARSLIVSRFTPQARMRRLCEIYEGVR